jgi:hypothetical protein
VPPATASAKSSVESSHDVRGSLFFNRP